MHMHAYSSSLCLQLRLPPLLQNSRAHLLP
jgi:hypothetical protein